MPSFNYDPAKGRFRAWLRAILVNQLRGFWRSGKTRPTTGDQSFYESILCQLEDPSSDLSRLWDREHDEHVSQRLLTLIEGDFSPSTWQAFQRVLAGDKPADVAADLGISVNAVIQAKSRVLKRLRHEMEGMTD